jgi:hypothetical protein
MVEQSISMSYSSLLCEGPTHSKNITSTLVSLLIVFVQRFTAGLFFAQKLELKHLFPSKKVWFAKYDLPLLGLPYINTKAISVCGGKESRNYSASLLKTNLAPFT